MKSGQPMDDSRMISEIWQDDSCESEHDFRDTVNTAVGKPLAAAVGTFSSNMPLAI